MSTIEITRVEDVRAGDVAIVKNGDTTVTGSVRAVERAWDVVWLTMQHLPNEIRIPHWTFVRATRELPDLPTKPGSVIVNATIRGVEGCTAMLDADGQWFSPDRPRRAFWHFAHQITAWTPARIVAEDGAS